MPNTLLKDLWPETAQTYTGIGVIKKTYCHQVMTKKVRPTELRNSLPETGFELLPDVCMFWRQCSLNSCQVYDLN